MSCGSGHIPVADQQIRATVREIIEFSPISLPEPWSKHAKDARKIEELNAACAGLNRIIFTIEENALSWPIADWRRSVEEIQRLIGHFIRKVHELKPAKPATDAIAFFRHRLNRYAQAIDVLAALFCTKSFDVEIARGAIFVGAVWAAENRIYWPQPRQTSSETMAFAFCYWGIDFATIKFGRKL